MEISLFDELGNETKYEILTAYKLLKTQKHYMLFTDHTYDENGRLNIYSAIYDPNDESVFEEVKSDYELEEVNKRILELRGTYVDR